MNTKARHLEIYTIAQSELQKAGGVETTDNLPQDQRQLVLRQMAKAVEEQANCHLDTAKRNVAKAMRRARGEIMKANWGGVRGGGRPRKYTP